MTQNTAAGEWKTGGQTQLEQNGKRWSRKAVKTIWQIRYALQCGTVLLIWELGLLNLSFHYSKRNPKDICSLQCSSQRALSVVLTVKSEFIFHFKVRKRLQCHPMDIWYIFRTGINNHGLLKATSSSSLQYLPVSLIYPFYTSVFDKDFALFYLIFFRNSQVPLLVFLSSK